MTEEKKQYKYIPCTIAYTIGIIFSVLGVALDIDYMYKYGITILIMGLYLK